MLLNIIPCMPYKKCSKQIIYFDEYSVPIMDDVQQEI